MGSNRDVRGICAQENGFRNQVAVGQYKKYNIKIMLGSGSELGGVRVWRAVPYFIHTLVDFYSRLHLSDGIFKNRKILGSWTILLTLEILI